MKRQATFARKKSPTAKRRRVAPQTQASFARSRPKSSDPEIHYFTVSDSTDATTTPTVVAVNSIAAGDTVITRDGNKVQQVALELRVIANNEAATANNRVRMVVVYDRHANTNQATWLDVFDAATIQSFPVVANKSRFKILLDETFTLNQTAATPLQKIFWHKFLRIKNSAQSVSYADGSATVPVEGSLSFMYLGDVATGAADCDFTVNARLYFYP